LLIALFAGVLVAGCGSPEESSPMPSTAGPPASRNDPPGSTSGLPVGAQPPGRVLGREGAERRRKQLARLFDRCERVGMRHQRIAAVGRFAGGRVLRIGYASSSSYIPCGVRLVATPEGIKVTMRTLAPRIALMNLLTWCVEVEPAARVPAVARFIRTGWHDPGPIRTAHPVYWRRLLGSADGCVWLDGTPVYRGF